MEFVLIFRNMTAWALRTRSQRYILLRNITDGTWCTGADTMVHWCRHHGVLVQTPPFDPGLTAPYLLIVFLMSLYFFRLSSFSLTVADRGIHTNDTMYEQLRETHKKNRKTKNKLKVDPLAPVVRYLCLPARKVHPNISERKGTLRIKDA